MPRPSRLKRWLLWSDTHAPYHDEAAVDALFRDAAAWRPDGVVVLGDFFDFYSVSDFPKDPGRAADCAEEILDGRDLLGRVRKLASEAVFVEGNHEARLARYVANRAPELHGLVPTIKQLVGPDWGFVPYKKLTKIGKLYVTHDLGKSGAGATRAALTDLGHGVAFGHTHRLQVEYGGTMDGERHCAMTCGWLGDVSQVDYIHQARAQRDWTTGVGAAYLDASGNYYLRPVPFVGRRFLF